MKFAKLQWADRLLGAAFGFIRGWLISAVILLALTAFEIQTERLKNSELAPYFLPGSRVIAVLTPYEMKAKFLVGYRASGALVATAVRENPVTNARESVKEEVVKEKLESLVAEMIERQIYLDERAG